MSKLESPRHDEFAAEVLRLAAGNVAQGGGPFACLVVKDGRVVAKGVNQVTPHKDPTAHAEVQAIRAACRALDDFELRDCEIYTSCEPCPMCLGAIYWSRVKAVYYCATRAQAAAAGFDDSLIYDEAAKPLGARLIPFHRVGEATSNAPFEAWTKLADRTLY